MSSSVVSAVQNESHAEVSAREARFLVQTYRRLPITIDRGEGCWFWDIAGRRYLDFITGIGVNALGHAHPRLLAMLETQAARCIHTSNLFHHRYQGLLAERLAEWSGLARVFFSSSGAEAVEAALKAARAAGKVSSPPKRRLVALHRGFHGRTMGALAVTGHPPYRQPFEPLDEVVFVEANDRDALRQAIDRDTAAVILEVVQGEGGIHPLSRAFLADVRALTLEAGAFWIADETQCGLGRTGVRFAFQMFEGIGLPDVVVTAKPLAGGLPLGATIFSETAAAALATGMHGTTFGGGPLACRVALEVLDIIDGLLPQIRATARHFHERLGWLARRHPVVREVRAVGLMAGLDLHTAGDPYVSACLDRGLAVNCTHETVLRLLPPLVVTEGEIDEAIEVLDAVLAGV